MKVIALTNIKVNRTYFNGGDIFTIEQISDCYAQLKDLEANGYIQVEYDVETPDQVETTPDNEPKKEVEDEQDGAKRSKKRKK